MKSAKDKYSSNRFLLTHLEYWKVEYILKIVNVLFHQLLKILYEHFYTHQSSVLDTFIQVKKRERERERKEKEEKGL